MKAPAANLPEPRQQTGSTVLVLITLLGILVMLAVANSKALFHLHQEIKLLENRQVERSNVSQGNAITTPARPPNGESK